MEVVNKRIIQNIFLSYFPRISNNKLPLKDIKAAEGIMQCCMSEQGYNYLVCPEGHEEKIQSHSCKHRSCPICADKSRHEWIEAQKGRLLDCAHYHVIFTLPHEYLTLWQYNRKWFTKALFKASRDTQIELLEDERYLGATPGIVMTLHSWGRQLNHPPIFTVW
ncbi:MAG: transposase zinc-binding domain-containing protein [Gammaproteobacteria bacterium]|nr:transposase zinc-binding domain-containing protein [Gammaproteobacteria bacterium]